MVSIMFKCDKCGLCCQNLDRSNYFNDLNDGTGTCIFFDKKTNLCKVYYERPLKCNVDLLYSLVLNKYMSKEEYYRLNYQMCQNMKSERK